ncbi:HEAT repeat domain-containing protein [Mangrovihabitans endophyticus]|uniref:HEAT repeat n=1 Tax=Mangrovihabitans endophyticus TaxID=1751298 RepID=A0A8J3FLX7_9ACTN|nr:HEAT repeat domain-containing protein [Mangrovihabitans endophyticus]GGK72316.1 hypothetical protein GCM10012284_02630 [Mangrovihabitans endophyticus]
MAGAFTAVVLVLAAVVATTGAGIVGARLWRQARRRRQAELAARPRRHLLAFAADHEAQGADALVAIAEPAWRAAEPGALGLLGKLRGDAHRALAAVFVRRGAAARAMAALHARGRVRRARAAQILGDLEHHAAVPDLCGLLTDRHREVRIVAVRALGRIGEPTAAWRLIAALDHADGLPSLLATHALAQLGPEAEITLSAALDHPAARVRAVCLDALGLLGAAGSAHRVARVLRDDPVPEVRVTAAASLGRLGTPAAVDPLVRATDAAEPVALRASAARALGEVGAGAAVPALAVMLGDAQYRVAHEAAHALRRLGPAGQRALRAAREEPADAHATGSTAAMHAREALALAEIATTAARR